MSKGIRLSKKFGVNPTIPVCFFCGEEKQEIALLGASYKGEAPMHMCIDYEPCDKCKAYWNKGTAAIEVTKTPIKENMPPIKTDGADSLYPTGRYMVINKESAVKLFNLEKEVDKILLEDNAFETILKHCNTKKEDKNGENN